jgi:hypothetical protein
MQHMFTSLESPTACSLVAVATLVGDQLLFYPKLLESTAAVRHAVPSATASTSFVNTTDTLVVVTVVTDDHREFIRDQHLHPALDTFARQLSPWRRFIIRHAREDPKHPFLTLLNSADQRMTTVTVLGAAGGDTDSRADALRRAYSVTNCHPPVRIYVPGTRPPAFDRAISAGRLVIIHLLGDTAAATRDLLRHIKKTKPWPYAGSKRFLFVVDRPTPALVAEIDASELAAALVASDRLGPLYGGLIDSDLYMSSKLRSSCV